MTALSYFYLTGLFFSIYFSTMTAKLENEVFQRDFRNEYHKGVVNLVYTSGFINTELQQLFSRYELTMQQFNILRILRGIHPESCSNSYIKERMLDKNSDVTRIISRLVGRGLVARKNAKSDRRKVDICIKPAGLELLAQMDENACEEEQILKNLSESEVMELNRLLDLIRG